MDFNTQALVVAPVVAACFVYAAWSLMPGTLRRRLAIALMRMPWVGQIPFVVRAAQKPLGCGCDGCDRSALRDPKANPKTNPKTNPKAVSKNGSGHAVARVIRIIPRPPRA